MSRLLGFCIFALACMGGVAPAAAQSSADRCQAARELLADPSGLSASEIDYFRAIVNSADCRRQKAAPRARAAAKPAAAAVAAKAPAKPRLVMPTGPFSSSQCTRATERLAVLQEARKHETDEGKIQYHIWSSADCKRHRRSGELHVDPGIAAMTDKLKANGIDIEARMPAEVARCRRDIERDMAGATIEQRAKMNREELESACILNARQQVYATAIDELNRKNQSEYRAKLAEVERRKQEIADKAAADQAEYDRRMREWRRAVALCEQGKREYCSAQ